MTKTLMVYKTVCTFALWTLPWIPDHSNEEIISLPRLERVPLWFWWPPLWLTCVNLHSFRTKREFLDHEHQGDQVRFLAAGHRLNSSRNRQFLFFFSFPTQQMLPIERSQAPFGPLFRQPRTEQHVQPCYKSLIQTLKSDVCWCSEGSFHFLTTAYTKAHSFRNDCHFMKRNEGTLSVHKIP